jgi:hypothetical protein
MTLPIRETPILHGDDARRFAENARTAPKRPIPRKDYERARKIYEEMNMKKFKKTKKANRIDRRGAIIFYDERTNDGLRPVLKGTRISGNIFGIR